MHHAAAERLHLRERRRDIADLEIGQREGVAGSASALAQAARSTALRRIATVDDVASATLFLASGLAAGVTGHLLPVDGGIL